MSNAYDLDTYPRDIAEFAKYKLTIQNCSWRTVNEYLLNLRLFVKYLYSKENSFSLDDESFENLDISSLGTDFFEKVTSNDIWDFLYYLKDSRSNSAATRARKMSAIRSFYKYMTVKKNKFENNPTINIETPKINIRFPKYLTEDECIRLLNAVKNGTNNPYRIRDYAILVLFLNSGLRLSELSGISLSDIDPDMRSLRVVGKGSKERIIYLNEACKSVITSYLPYRKSDLEGKAPNDALFVSRLGKRISPKTVQYLVKRHLKEAGLENRHLSTHKLRHTAATLMYQTGKVDIRVLKDILGHEQLTTTQIYTHVSSEGMERAMESNPLANVKMSGEERNDGD